MTDVILCAGCGKGLRPGQIGTWAEFTALEGVGLRTHRIRARRYTGRVFCAECALPPETGRLWVEDPEVPGAAGNTGPMASKPLIGAAR